jgi:hypothetical protein
MTSACPEHETLAALADGALLGDEREAVVRHVAFCSECYAVYAETLHFQEESAAASGEARSARAEEPAASAEAAAGGATPAPVGGRVIAFEASRRRRWAMVALPLAAAAALVVVVAPRLGGPGGGPTPSPSIVASASPIASPSPPSSPTVLSTSAATEATPATLLLRHTAPGPLVPRAWRGETASLGFGGGPGARSRALSLGVRLTDLEVALRAGPPHSAEAFGRFIRWLSTHAYDDATLAHYAALQVRLAEGREVGPASLVPTGGFDAEWLRLGRWLEACRLAAGAGERAFFDDALTKDALELAQSRLTDAAARAELARAERLLARPDDRKTSEQLQAAFTEALRIATAR